jgi:hypothetical protein
MLQEEPAQCADKAIQIPSREFVHITELKQKLLLTTLAM